MKYTGKWWDSKHRTEPEREFTYGVVKILYIVLIVIGAMMLLSSCEKDYGSGQNHIYMFSAKTHVDQWGIETWGGHNFIMDDKVQNMETFKECYVNYLNWSGLDIDGHYKKIYYTDHKNVNIKYMGTTPHRFTVKAIDNCQ